MIGGTAYRTGGAGGEMPGGKHRCLAIDEGLIQPVKSSLAHGLLLAACGNHSRALYHARRQDAALLELLFKLNGLGQHPLQRRDPFLDPFLFACLGSTFLYPHAQRSQTCLPLGNGLGMCLILLSELLQLRFTPGKRLFQSGQTHHRLGLFLQQRPLCGEAVDPILLLFELLDSRFQRQARAFHLPYLTGQRGQFPLPLHQGRGGTCYLLLQVVKVERPRGKSSFCTPRFDLSLARRTGCQRRMGLPLLLEPAPQLLRHEQSLARFFLPCQSRRQEKLPLLLVAGHPGDRLPQGIHIGQAEVFQDPLHAGGESLQLDVQCGAAPLENFLDLPETPGAEQLLEDFLLVRRGGQQQTPEFSLGKQHDLSELVS